MGAFECVLVAEHLPRILQLVAADAVEEYAASIFDPAALRCITHNATILRDARHNSTAKQTLNNVLALEGGGRHGQLCRVVAVALCHMILCDTL